MAQILNDRDKALQTAPYRSVTDAISISATASAFLASKNTVTILPASITLTATPSGSSYGPLAVYTWTYTTSDAPNTSVAVSSGANLKTITVNNDVAWLKLSTIPPFVTYKCVVTESLLDTAVSYYQLSYTREASDPVIVNLTRSNVLVTCDSTGQPTSLTNTDQTITVNRGDTALTYNSSAAVAATAIIPGNSYTIISPGTTDFTAIGAANSTEGTTFIAGPAIPTGTGTVVKNSANTFVVGYTSTNLTPVAGTGSGTSWVQPAITGITTTADSATITYTVTVFDSATPPAPTKYYKTVVYNKVSNGTIGADGANLNPLINYDFAGASLPSGVTYSGTVATSDNDTTTTITTAVGSGYLRLTGLNLLAVNSYIVSVRIKVIQITGTWNGKVYFTSNSLQTENTTYYKTIPQPALGVWTTINLDMRQLSSNIGNNNQYMASGNINSILFDFISASGSQIAIDYISVGKYGVAEATKSVTASMYVWAPATQALEFTQPFTYTWNGGTVDYYPVAYTDTLVTPSVVRSWASTAGSAPGSGYVLYQRNITITDVKSATTTPNLNWNGSSVNTIGYRTDGSVGPQGDSARVAYVVTTGVWTNPTSPTSNLALAPTTAITITATQANSGIVTISTSLPLAVGTKITLNSGTAFGGLAPSGVYYVKYFISSIQVILSSTSDLTGTLTLTTATGSLTGTTDSWSLTATATLADGQYMYQSDGLLNSNQQTPSITWGTPYLSNLKVGSLSAISANLGSVKVATGGALYTDGKTFSGTTTAGFFLGDDGGTQKFKVGNAAGTAGLSWDGSTLTANALEIKDSSGTTVIAANTKAAEIFNSSIQSSRNLLQGLHTWLFPATNNILANARAIDNRAVVAGNGYALSAESPEITLDNLANYTLSFEAFCGTGGTRTITAQLSPDNITTQFILTSTPTLFKVTWTAGNSSPYTVKFTSGAGLAAYIYNVQLEYGSNRTLWKPSDLDTQNSILEASKLNKSGTDILTGKISLAVTDAIYTGNTTNGLFLGSQGITALSSSSPSFTIDASTGNATFKGNITGSNGVFAGTLQAGVLDFTQFAGTSIACTTTTVVQVPTDKTSMRVTLVGGGGGGGGYNGRPEMLTYTSQGGGGGGVLISGTYTGLTPGAYYTVTIGAGGAPGLGRDGAYSNGSPGGDGGSTYINPGQTSNFATAIAVATGGKGGTQSSNGPSGGQAGTPSSIGSLILSTAGTYDRWETIIGYGTRNSEPVYIYNYGGGAGGKNTYSTGGTSPNWVTPGTPPTGYGGGGYGGAGGHWTGNNYAIPAGAVAGTSGYALIEFFNPNMVVLASDFTNLKTALTQQNIRITPI